MGYQSEAVWWAEVQIRKSVLLESKQEKMKCDLQVDEERCRGLSADESWEEEDELAMETEEELTKYEETCKSLPRQGSQRERELKENTTKEKSLDFSNLCYFLWSLFDQKLRICKVVSPAHGHKANGNHPGQSWALRLTSSHIPTPRILYNEISSQLLQPDIPILFMSGYMLFF